jgi:hypothetical protein
MPRCPNGSTRDKKTGECVKKNITAKVVKMRSPKVSPKKQSTRRKKTIVVSESPTQILSKEEILQPKSAKLNTVIDLSIYEISEEEFNNYPTNRTNAVKRGGCCSIGTDKIDELYNLDKTKEKLFFNYNNILFTLELIKNNDVNAYSSKFVIIKTAEGKCSKLRKLLKTDQIEDELIRRKLDKLKKTEMNVEPSKMVTRRRNK